MRKRIMIITTVIKEMVIAMTGLVFKSNEEEEKTRYTYKQIQS